MQQNRPTSIHRFQHVILEDNYAIWHEAEMEADFEKKECAASTSRTFYTFSTLICIAQIIYFSLMITIWGVVPILENPMIGPPVTILVRFGAKEAALMKYYNQWWRLFSAIFVHAGVLHLIPNVFIQLQVGGYLNVIFTTPVWLWIYIVSGMFGFMLSCIFEPNSVGVGSSGSLMGMLTAWVVWIVFRWKKIPLRGQGQRNFQLAMLMVGIALTLGTSFVPHVDWAAHLGGSIQVSPPPVEMLEY